MVEYSSPNTNKPLHLGHIRNILLGWSCSKILEAAGYDVVRTKVVNDRGIAICKSMLAWQLFGDEKTPNTEGVKGDHFVGDYYVMFENEFKKEYKSWQNEVSLDDLGALGHLFDDDIYDYKKWKIKKEFFVSLNKKNLPKDEFFKEFKNDYFNKYSKLGAQAREMLLKWEGGDAETLALWQRMNGWVYDGFNETYKSLGVHFDKIYYESSSYLLGKDIIEAGFGEGYFLPKTRFFGLD